MPNFRLLDLVDATLVSQEGRDPKASRTPSVWPSEASADRIDKTEGPIVGTCHRKSFGRMVGWPVTNQIDPVGAWRFVTGRSVESHLTTLTIATEPKIYAASGVRHYVKDIYLPFELDLVVKDPETNRGWVVECKTIYGYMANKQIMQDSKPKLENIMQIALYLLEIKNGKRLKEIIEAGAAEKFAYEAKELAEGRDPKPTRNRIHTAAWEFVSQIDDGPIGAKLVYISRDECLRKEFEITIQEDFDGSSYPCIDGMMWKVFTVESIYERYKTLQNHWFAARAEAERRLEAKGVVAPPTLRLVRGHGDSSSHEETLTEEQKKAEYTYLTRLERETASLPVEFWPPAEFQWAFTPDKIELLFQRGLIGKKKYDDWKKKKKGADRIGDWQCLYCPFKKMCVPHQNPSWAYQLYDMDDMLPVEELGREA